ncbi:MAG: hypothetical protein H6708_31225 [Kofleriaceae bacterium]|nr:hypothetical protein [Kofleriaceae bacterium]
MLALTPLHHALGLDGFGVPHHHAAATTAATVPATAPAATPVPGEPTEQLIVSDAWVALRIAVPLTLEPGASHDLTIEVWDADGRPLDTTDLVVTFAGPGGAVIGQAAAPARERGVYRLRARFDDPGTWTMRVFPPLGDSMLQIPLEVGTRPQS